jgi:transcriptional regulator with GAF, ATPase, and Fis domain
MPLSDVFAVSLASDLLSAVGRSKDAGQFRESALATLRQHFGEEKIAWLHQSDIHWAAVGSSTALSVLPVDIAAAAADELEVTRGEGWLAVPITTHHAPAEVLLVSPAQAMSVELAQAMGSLLRTSLNLAKTFSSFSARHSQLETLLELADQWQRNPDLVDLLQSMAHTAARVLNGDRATIFLWDKTAKELVGYPALGVEGQRLRVPDNQGIVGEVLRTKEPKRWDHSQDPKSINQRIGQQLGYATQSLVAAPLLDRKNRPLGVFEVLNNRRGEFSSDDQVFLGELARFAGSAVENLQQISHLIQSRDRLVRLATSSATLIGESPPITALRETITRVAATDLAVLILGENGTGKEVVAKSLHLQSERNDQPFVAVNCAAVVESLIESELFGHEKGAFTDAVNERMGKFELASGGTLFLDEIGELSPAGQAKLLRVLEDKVITRVGSEKPTQTDVRVIAATNRDLVSLIKEKKFREDLFFRLTVVTLNLPPLRERGDDVVVLAEYFLRQFAHEIGRRAPQLTDSARRRLRSHSWPGNIRELRNLMERISYLTHSDSIEESDLAFVISPGSSSDVAGIPANISLSQATDLFQKQYIQQHVDVANGNLAQVAKQLGLHRSNLYRKMNQLGMDAK